ncbi:MAG: glycerol kinase GlpK [Caulobacterales bacterium]
MSAAPFILAIDQGTTSSRAIAFGLDGGVIAVAQQEFAQIYPQPGWVEHDPEVIWATVLSTGRACVAEAQAKGYALAAIGIANQRETTVLWDRETGAPVGNAIVWQDRRTADVCRRLAEGGLEATIAAKTGLVLDPYFSASKLAWLLDHIPGARARAEAGKLAFGTIDSFLVWRLTGGAVHATDATNASRTSLYDIVAGRWDDELLAMFRAPPSVLPEVRDTAGDFGVALSSVFGAAAPIRAVVGDQQAAAIGQACFSVGEVKSTYGTGAFLLLNTGEVLVRSRARLLGTIAYRLAGRVAYALEGSILSAGATITWLRDALGIISEPGEAEALARSVQDSGGVTLVPAFAGLGAPHWDPEARGALLGLTRGTGRAEIARAALESTVHQTCDLIDAMAADGLAPAALKVDGGMARSDWLLQDMADMTGLPVVRPVLTETTAFGAAAFAALGAGLYSGLDDIRALWRPQASFAPNLSPDVRAARAAAWRAAVARVLSGQA